MPRERNGNGILKRGNPTAQGGRSEVYCPPAPQGDRVKRVPERGQASHSLHRRAWGFFWRQHRLTKPRHPGAPQGAAAVEEAPPSLIPGFRKAPRRCRVLAASPSVARPRVTVNKEPVEAAESCCLSCLLPSSSSRCGRVEVGGTGHGTRPHSAGASGWIAALTLGAAVPGTEPEPWAAARIF